MIQLETSGGEQRPYEPLNRVLVIYQRVGSCQYGAISKMGCDPDIWSGTRRS